MTQLPGVPERPAVGAPSEHADGNPPSGAAFDPLRLCIYTTIALLAWAFGPVAVLAFALLGLAGYWRAHQAGLTQTKCYLRDVRLVLLYLGLAVVGAVAGIVWAVSHWHLPW